MDLDHPFEGNALNAVDAKGRVSVPSSFRDLIAERCRIYAPAGTSPNPASLSLSIGENDQIRAYDAIGMQQLSRELRASVADLPAAERRAALAKLGTRETGNSFAVTFDSAGRLVLPEMLRDFAEIEGLALFWGTIDYFEIWNPMKALAAWADDANLVRSVRFLLKQRGITIQ